jgi:hypothetical protein
MLNKKNKGTFMKIGAYFALAVVGLIAYRSYNSSKDGGASFMSSIKAEFASLFSFK